MPVEKTVGEEVFAGTLNQQGAIELEVTRLAADSTLARMVRMVEEAVPERIKRCRFLITKHTRQKPCCGIDDHQ